MFLPLNQEWGGVPVIFKNWQPACKLNPQEVTFPAGRGR